MNGIVHRVIMAIILILAFVLVGLGLSACDGGDSVDDPDTRGVARAGGAAGTDMIGSQGGAGDASYVPDPAPACAIPQTSSNTLLACDDGIGKAPNEIPSSSAKPSFDASGSQCYDCIGWDVPPSGCVIHIPAAISGGVVTHPARDIFCAAVQCDPMFCQPK